MNRIHELMKYETAGDPMTGTKWVRTTPEKIAGILRSSGIQISRNTVARLLKEAGVSLKANRKSIAIQRSPDRDKQFRKIGRLRKAFEAEGAPIISVDTKKRELLGPFKRSGRVWARQARQVYDYDYPSTADGVAIPYGIYDVQENQGVIVVGTSRDTAEFAVNCIAKWWRYRGQYQYSTHELLILADSGGSNGCRPRAWKIGIQEKLCNRYGLTVTVAHYPTGASKWNPVEHRLFSEISKNWQGRPLDSVETVLNYIERTTTSSGLRVKPYLDSREYAKGVKIPPEAMQELSLEKARFLGKWNYTIQPN